ncbi:MAG: PLDc N-terminal domain-containing protein [Kiritimatiellia bacterium]
MHAEAVVFGLFFLVSFVCMLHLWLRRDTAPGVKLLWTFVLFVPLAGPIFYGGLFRPPDPSRYRKHWPDDRGGLPPGGAAAGMR